LKKKLYGKVKYMSLLLAVTVFVMGFSMFTVTGNTPAHIYGGDETTTAGSVVTLPLFIENNPGVAAFTLELSYDTDALSFESVTAVGGSDFEIEQWMLIKNGDCFLWSNDKVGNMLYNTEGEGEMFDLAFKVADDAQPGVYPVEISLKDNQAANISDCYGEPVEVTFTAGIIRIEDNSGAVTVKNVTLFKPADKLAYWTGEDFDITGAQLEVEWSDSSKTYVDVTEQMLEAIPDTDTVGTKTVQVKYENWEFVNDLTFDITVSDPTIKDVTLYTPADKLDYWTGETFDITGAQLKVEWTNDDVTYIDVTEQMLEAVPDTSSAGTKTVQVIYQGWEDKNDLTFDINVEDPELKNVTLYTPADKLTYWTGDNFDITGAQLKLEWTNDDITYINVTEQMLEAMPDMSTAGTKTIQVEYLGWEDVNDLTFDIEVNAVTIKNVTLYKKADKLTYWTGEDFDITGAQLKVEWSNDDIEYIDVTEQMLEAIPNTDTAGTKKVQIVYQGWEDKNDLTFDITVKAPSVINVTMNPAPTQKEFNQGDEFNSDGGKLKIEYDHGDPTYIDITEDMCSGYDMNTPGEQEVTVTYNGYTFTYVINVVGEANPPSGDDTAWLLPVTALLMSGAVVAISIYLKKKKAVD